LLSRREVLAHQAGGRMNRFATLVTTICAAAVFAVAPRAGATPISIGVGAFSGSQTILTFESLSSFGAPLPAGYGSSSGIQFSPGTKSESYTQYSAALTASAAANGLGNVAATFGCVSAACGSGFSFDAPVTRVGFWIGSNVAINTTIHLYLNGSQIGVQLVTGSADVMKFVGFENAAGIDQVVFGTNQYIYQLDNVMFENTAVPEPASVLLLGTGLMAIGRRLRGRHGRTRGSRRLLA
jgi:hypothetical protein